MVPLDQEPTFLKNYTVFKDHLDELWEAFSPSDKGRSFAELSRKTLDATDELLYDLTSESGPGSHDGGVDITWFDSSKRVRAVAQVKYTIRGKEDIDGILSKFESFTRDRSQLRVETDIQQLSLLPSSNERSESPDLHFYIVTLRSNLDLILSRYESSNVSSLSFYLSLKRQDRIHILDGYAIYDLFLKAYRREFTLPKSIHFPLVSGIVQHGDVYLGIMSAVDLVRIYRNSGDGIFFENVRDFIGLGKSDTLEINNEIYKTARDMPSRMLERNNGITFKATGLTLEGETLFLENAGIINGCQTTVCISRALEVSEQTGDSCFVTFKVVKIKDEEGSLDIAKTANTQNKIDKINLELAEYIRPQLLKTALAEHGVEIDEAIEDKVPSIASVIATRQVFKSDLRYLFIALFSTPPRNTFRSDYTSIKFDEVAQHFRTLEDKKLLISQLARLIVLVDKIKDSLRTTVSDPSQENILKTFKRLLDQGKGYKAYITVIALCCFSNIASEAQYREMLHHNFQRLPAILDQILEQETQEFRQVWVAVFRSVVITATTKFGSNLEKELDDTIAQDLNNFMRNTQLDIFYKSFGALSFSIE